MVYSLALSSAAEVLLRGLPSGAGGSGLYVSALILTSTDKIRIVT